MPAGIFFFQPPVSAIETRPAAAEAKPYKIVFRGNQALNEMALRKAAVDELTAFKKQGQRRSDVDDAAYQMELAYRKAGHAFAAVDYRIEQVAEELVVAFSVNEGPRVILGKINVALTGDPHRYAVNGTFLQDEFAAFDFSMGRHVAVGKTLTGKVRNLSPINFSYI